ncbi:hypothetical protein pb186bvf_006484 [Paramecium bursaria]
MKCLEQSKIEEQQKKLKVYQQYSMILLIIIIGKYTLTKLLFYLEYNKWIY